MKAPRSTDGNAVARRWAGATDSLAPLIILLVVLTGARILLLTMSAMNLQVDEAQYWDWSRHLAFGYFSKPPMIAWTIAAAGALCGSAEACVRLPAPLFYFVTPLLIYAIGHALYGSRVAFWAAIGFALAPGVSFSSQIMSTDVLLLFFWSLALTAFVRLRAGGPSGWIAVLGIALGFGLLAKYAMLYFVGCALIAAFVDRDSRALVASWRFWLAVAVGLAMLAPNLVWNIGNHFVTFRHTSENISGGGGPKFHPFEALGFFASQFGIIGPFLFGGMLAAAYALWRHRKPAAAGSTGATARHDRMLLAFALPVVIVVTIAGCFNSANANWGAAAFVSTAVVAAAYLVRTGRDRLLEASVAIGLFAQLVLLVGGAFADRVSLPFVKHGDVYAQVLGWRDLADRVRAHAEAAGATTIIANARNETSTLNYYLRSDPALNVSVWPDDPTPDDHFELTRSVVDHPPPGVALVVAQCVDEAHLAPFFGDVRSDGQLAIPTGPGSTRRYKLFRLDQIHLPLRAVPLCGRDRN